MQEIKELIKKVIHDLYHLDFDPELTPSPENIDADYSTNAPLKLAKDLHKAPMEIAKEILDNLVRMNGIAGDTTMVQSGASTAKEAATMGPTHYDNASISNPGFLNFTLSGDYLESQISDLSRNFNQNISSGAYSGKTVICEFSDPNPFKVLHVGHLYTSIVGDSIARLFEFAGAKVIRANFGGDVGLHVAKTLYVLRQKNLNDFTIDDIARCYVEGTALYDDNEKAHQEITALNKEIYQINADGDNGRAMSSKGDSQNIISDREIRQVNSDGISYRQAAELGDPTRSVSDVGEDTRLETVEKNNLADLYWRGRELSYDYFNEFYDSVGVHFDKYYPESTVASLGLEKVKAQLEKGVYEYSDGAVIFDGEKFGLHTRVFINKAGVPTYETKDVGLIFTKWQDYHFDKSVVITGNEQLEYMKVVLKSVEQYAPELVEKTTHLTHGLVKLPGNVKMSSRKGNFLKAVDVLEMVKSALKDEHDSNDGIIALAATKYAFLKYKMGGNIIFDPHESVKMTGNSGPYLLYSAVRAKKILAKAGIKESRDAQRVNSRDNGYEQGDERAHILGSPERNLMKKILEYKSVLQEAVSEMAPHKVANYLYELAQDFSRFYENCPVAGSDREEERIRLVQVYLDTMSHGLNLLGITIPEAM